MKTIISILALLIISLSISAQTAVKKDCISSGGNVVTNGNTKIIYTVGEFAVQENTQGTVHISEGFINPDLLIATGLANYSVGHFDVNIFPNPARDYVNVKFSKSCKYNINLYDVDGKIIHQYSSESNRQRINLGNLSNGEYMLLVKNVNNKSYKSFKLIKQ